MIAGRNAGAWREPPPRPPPLPPLPSHSPPSSWGAALAASRRTATFDGHPSKPPLRDGTSGW